MLRALIATLAVTISVQAAELHVTYKDYLETQGLNVLVYQNAFHPVFKDQKLSAIKSFCTTIALPPTVTFA